MNSHVKKKVPPFWILWFYVSGHNSEIIWSLASLKNR